jgi:hypothetical protein
MATRSSLLVCGLCKNASLVTQKYKASNEEVISE